MESPTLHGENQSMVSKVRSPWVSGGVVRTELGLGQTLTPMSQQHSASKDPSNSEAQQQQHHKQDTGVITRLPLKLMWSQPSTTQGFGHCGLRQTEMERSHRNQIKKKTMTRERNKLGLFS